MKFKEASIPGVYIIELEPISDERGSFARVFCEKEMQPFLGDLKWVQINHSYNKLKGTFRGMHYQLGQDAEKKMIRCVAGGVMDFVLDVRVDSPTYLKHLQIELDPIKNNMVFVPEGVAHGFQTLTDNAQLIYHHSKFYNPTSERGIRYDDPEIDIKLPLPLSLISEKDLSYPWLNKSAKL